MIISHEYKFIFVHAIRTGGTSIEKVLALYGVHYGGHIKFYQIKEQFEGFYNKKYNKELIPKIDLTNAVNFEDYFKFVFVRNIYDWMISIYHYNSKTVPTQYRLSLYDAIHSWLNKPATPPLLGYPFSQHKFDRHRFVLDKDGSFIPDFIGRFENLQDDFNTICKYIGIPQTVLPKLNSVARQPNIKFDKPLQGLVEQYWDFDIEKIGNVYNNE